MREQYIWIFVVVVAVILVLRAISVKTIGKGSNLLNSPSSSPFKRKNPVDVPTPPGLRNSEEVRQLIADGKLILAIKIVREELGIGLKESKDYVEALREGKMPEVSISGKPSTPIGSVDAEAQAMIREGKVIEAIKFVRKKTGLGLKEAKDYVDRLMPPR